MIPVRFRQNQPDEVAGGFIEDDVTGIFPSGLASDDGCGGNPVESDCDGGDSGADREI